MGVMDVILFLLSIITLTVCLIVLGYVMRLRSELRPKKLPPITPVAPRREGAKVIPRPAYPQTVEAGQKEEVRPAVKPEEQRPAVPLADKLEVFKTAHAARTVDRDGTKITPHKFEPTMMPTRQAGKKSEELLAAAAQRRAKLEQWIGTRGLLVAGIVTTIFATGFFLKFAADNNLIGPWGRVAIVAAFGAIALLVGEWTRRKDYGVVARGLTALGFAMLYASVFGAYGYYKLTGPTVAYGLSILITIAAMAYAVGQDEIIAAFTALLGGYLSPILLSTGENRPHMLFSYLSILSIGAMLCAIFRKWRAVNWLAFTGSFLLYILWFTRFYQPALSSSVGMPKQLPTAVSWLGVFFFIFLVLPILHELIKKITARREDVALILSNAMLVFGLFGFILYKDYDKSFALVSLGLFASHLVLKQIARKRNRADVSLGHVLLSLSLFFLTVAIPLYFDMYAVATSWAAQGVILMVIALRYRSKLTGVGSYVSFLLSLIWLTYHLPLQEVSFRFVFNKPFGSWIFVVASFYVCHVISRRSLELPRKMKNLLIDITFGFAWFLMFAAVAMEWYHHTNLNLVPTKLQPYHLYFLKGLIPIITVFMLLCIIRPICPVGKMWTNLSVVICLTGSIFTCICFLKFYYDRFVIFINGSFVLAFIFVLGTFTAAWLTRRNLRDNTDKRKYAMIFALTGVFCLWILLTEEIYLYWHYLGKATGELSRCRFLGQMYVSVMWAVYAGILMGLGFWKRVAILRYIALGFFALVLGKVFIFDISNLSNIYRIAGFVVLGFTLVGISYLYQYAKKKGLFADMLTGQDTEKKTD